MRELGWGERPLLEQILVPRADGAAFATKLKDGYCFGICAYVLKQLTSGQTKEQINRVLNARNRSDEKLPMVKHENGTNSGLFAHEVEIMLLQARQQQAKDHEGLRELSDAIMLMGYNWGESGHELVVEILEPGRQVVEIVGTSRRRSLRGQHAQPITVAYLFDPNFGWFQVTNDKVDQQTRPKNVQLAKSIVSNYAPQDRIDRRRDAAIEPRIELTAKSISDCYKSIVKDPECSSRDYRVNNGCNLTLQGKMVSGSMCYQIKPIPAARGDEEGQMPASKRRRI